MAVHVQPMPEAYRKIKKIFRPQHPPVFVDIEPGGITPEDIEEAVELFKILDQESQEWYGGEAFLERLIKLI